MSSAPPRPIATETCFQYLDVDANKRQETLHAVYRQEYQNSSYLDDIKHGQMIRAKTQQKKKSLA
jgi:hypothetical protein